LFIDEIHRLNPIVEESLYPAMEDFRIDFILGEGINARTMSIPLKRFTLIGATTRSGMLSSPMRDRFKMHEHLEFYSIEERTFVINPQEALPATLPEQEVIRNLPNCSKQRNKPSANRMVESSSKSPASLTEPRISRFNLPRRLN
jgi:Holliday junction DNA helicase RuvB